MLENDAITSRESKRASASPSEVKVMMVEYEGRVFYRRWDPGKFRFRSFSMFMVMASMGAAMAMWRLR